MDEERIKEVMNHIENISNKCTNDEFNIAIYLYVRYGKSIFDNYIDSEDLDKINQELKRHTTLFDEELNYNIDKILNAKE